MTSGPPAGASRGRPGSRVAVIIPALNEESSILLVLRDIPADAVADVLVVDNGSTDDTARVAAEHGARVVSEPRRGYGAACLAGIAALPAQVEVVVFLDADYSDYPEEMTALLEPIERDEADLVVGSRMAGGAGRRVLPPQSYWGNRLAVFLIRLIWGFRYTDLGPFRAIRRDALERLGMADRNFGWTVEMQVRALEEGLRVVERPVRYRKRIGVSKITGTVSGTIRAGTKILWTILRFACARRRSRTPRARDRREGSPPPP